MLFINSNYFKKQKLLFGLFLYMYKCNILIKLFILEIIIHVYFISLQRKILIGKSNFYKYYLVCSNKLAEFKAYLKCCHGVNLASCVSFHLTCCYISFLNKVIVLGYLFLFKKIGECGIIYLFKQKM